MSEDDLPAAVRLADTVYESVRGINHATISRKAIAAPEVYSVLGSLKLLGVGLDQALSQLGAGLGRSLDVYDVYEDNGADPLVSVVMAVDLLTEARTHALALGRLLEQAQGAISRQGYREPVDVDGPATPDDEHDPVCGCDSPAARHGQSFHVTPQTQAAARQRAAKLAGPERTHGYEDDPDDPLACMRCRVGAPLPHQTSDPACALHQG